MIARMLELGRPYAPRYAIGFGLLLATNALGLWIPWLLRDAVRAMEAGAAVSVVGAIAAWMIVVALAQAVVRTGSRLANLGGSRRIVFDLRNRFFAKLQQQGATYFDGQRTGDIMSRGVNDVRLVQGFFGPGLLNLLNTAIVYVAVMVLLLRIDVRLTLISLVLYPLLFFGVNRLSRRVYRRSVEVQEQLATIANRVQESISGIQQVKIYVQEERELESFRTLSAEFRRRNLSMASLRGAMLALIGAVSGLGILIVLYAGGRAVISGRMDLGDFVAFNAYLGLLVWPTIALGWIINTIQRGTGAMHRIGEVLDAEPELPPPDDGPPPEPIDGDLVVRGLSFSYVGEDGSPGPPVLRDVDLTIPRGSRVAIVGPVGSGKSTLAHLLARLYPVPDGTISIGGTDINAIPLRRLRHSVGYVPQEAFLFSETLRANVEMGVTEPEVDESRVLRAIDLSHLSADVRGFADGLETLVGERGVTLSGGQRQRTTLARAIVGERRVLVLDDSLASVDADTERSILEGLHEHAQGRTLILVTHRPSTLAGMDRIIVLDNGEVAEQGTHEELLERGGLYALLFRRDELTTRLAT